MNAQACATGMARAVLQDGALQRTVGALTDVLARMIDSPQPTVASVHGLALAPWSVRQTKRLLSAVETCGMDAPLQAGDALNPLLRAHAQLVPAIEGAPETSERLRRELGGGGRT